MTDEPAKPWTSRLIVIGIFAWIAAFGAGALFLSLRPPAEGKKVLSPFKPWDGVWEGEVTTTAPGQEPRKTRIHAEFRHVTADKDFRQEGHLELTDEATGAVERESLLRMCDFDFGHMQSKWIRDRDNLVILRRGKAEGGSLYWESAEPGLVENTREWIEGDEFRVEGTMRQKGAPESESVKISGRYRKVEGK